MLVGLLWYDKDPKIPFAQKIEEAAERYREKYGVEPNTCYVNPATLPPGAVVPGFELRVRATIRPDHFWLGITEDAQPAPRITPVETALPPTTVATRPKRKSKAA